MYIDPGSTNFIIQILIGAAAGAGLAIATFWRRIRMFFSRDKGGDKEASASPPTKAQTPTAPADVPMTPPPPSTPPSSTPPSSTPPAAAPPAPESGSASTAE